MIGEKLEEIKGKKKEEIRKDQQRKKNKRME